MKSGFVFINLLIVLGFTVLRTKGQLSGDLRLVSNSGGTGGSSGRLEVYYSGQWGTVCDDFFSVEDARVACRQLRFSDYSRYGSVGLLGFRRASSFTRTWLDNLHCTGSESRLIDCPTSAIFEDCSHSEDIALICSGPRSRLLSGDLRLVSTSGNTGGSSGRLEVYYSGRWGTVCDDRFGTDDARVACRQLGFSTSGSQYGSVGSLGFSQASSSTPIWLDDLRCSGSESRLIDCISNPIGLENCGHSEDIALICRNIPQSTLTAIFIITGGMVGLITFCVICLICICICVISYSKRRRVQIQYPRVVTSNRTIEAYPLQQLAMSTPVNLSRNPQAAFTQPCSGPQQPPAPFPTGQPLCSSGSTAPQANGELTGLYSDAPPDYGKYYSGPMQHWPSTAT